MSFEVDGRLHKKYETEKKTETFQAREFVLEIQDGNYPQFIKFQLVQDRCGILDSYEEGQEVKVFFDLRGREWNGKYFTNLNAWRMDWKSEAAPAPAQEDPFAEASFPPFPAEEKGGSVGSESSTPEDMDDLPF